MFPFVTADLSFVKAEPVLLQRSSLLGKEILYKIGTRFHEADAIAVGKIILTVAVLDPDNDRTAFYGFKGQLELKTDQIALFKNGIG